MKSYSFTPQGVCAKRITFAIGDDGKLHDVHFVGGCPGNLSAIGKLLEGADPQSTADLLQGNDCRGRGTSCADQLAIALNGALGEQ
ncbi:TIGR03905 family TSCPD domain-containing protein [uncultured Mitsuokella sp.]|uniref:TIGR03905 family TSCPD domain-containing protein n=1 Tax=uncultured Mitsuokella sp. TaxID=453120 RepID=UPI0025990AA9|nr:TIGR03905 family TSCPD domain-containing protein [uncultured Mitsuokella sp.]